MKIEEKILEVVEYHVDNHNHVSDPNHTYQNNNIVKDCATIAREFALKFAAWSNPSQTLSEQEKYEIAKLKLDIFEKENEKID